MLDNELGIYRDAPQASGASKLAKLAESFQGNPLLQPLVSIGMADWLLLLLFVFYALDNEGKKALLCLLPLFVVGTLLIATPVYSEFRYAYCVFTTLPLLLSLIDVRDGIGR